MSTLDYYNASFAKEITATTGLGDYALGGTVSGFSPFSYYFGDAAYLLYSVTDGVSYEVGIGKFNASPNTITRISVINSPVGFSAINWGAGNKIITCAPIGEICGPINGVINTPNLGAASPSIVGPPNFAVPGAILMDINDTGNSTLAIMMHSTPGVGSSGVYRRIQTQDTSNSAGYGLNAGLIAGFNNTAAAINSAVTGRNGKSVRAGSLVVGCADNATTNGGAQTEQVGLSATTTNATPAAMTADGTAGNVLVMPINSSILMDANILAYSNASSLASAWNLKALYRRGASGAPVLIGSPTATMLYQDSSASSWSVATSVDATNNAAGLNVTGAASTIIRWVAEVRIAHAGF